MYIGTCTFSSSLTHVIHVLLNIKYLDSLSSQLWDGNFIFIRKIRTQIKTNANREVAFSMTKVNRSLMLVSIYNDDYDDDDDDDDDDDNS